jgi:hypothetical protein
LYRRQKQGDQDADDGDDHQQLHERERSISRGTSHRHILKRRNKQKAAATAAGIRLWYGPLGQSAPDSLLQKLRRSGNLTAASSLFVPTKRQARFSVPNGCNVFDSHSTGEKQSGFRKNLS